MRCDAGPSASGRVVDVDAGMRAMRASAGCGPLTGGSSLVSDSGSPRAFQRGSLLPIDAGVDPGNTDLTHLRGLSVTPGGDDRTARNIRLDRCACGAADHQDLARAHLATWTPPTSLTRSGAPTRRPVSLALVVRTRTSVA